MESLLNLNLSIVPNPSLWKECEQNSWFKFSVSLQEFYIV